MRTDSIRKLLLTTLIVALSTLALPTASFAGVFVSITVAPPLLPVYVQPVCPGPEFIWTPGYWAYGNEGYYWVPGTWVLAPRVGVLWTPGYWGFAGGYYAWHPGYWGPHVGFYGGVNYGFGYTGIGFGGGMWVGEHFSYNTAVTNVNTTVIHNTYVNKTVINNNTTVNRNSFNGPNGVTAQPTAEERAASREQHVAPTAAQVSHQNSASMNRAQLASVNHGRPANLATTHPGAAVQGNARAPMQSTAKAGMPRGNAQAAAHPNPGPPPHPANAHPQGRPQANQQHARPEGGPREHRP
jgi:hypothetical protein